MTEEELEKKVKRVRAENRAVMAEVDAAMREFKREAPIRTLTTELAFRRLREAARRR